MVIDITMLNCTFFSIPATYHMKFIYETVFANKHTFTLLLSPIGTKQRPS